jgi:hypothetical protein
MIYVWQNRSKELPAKIARIQGTQLAEAYRRNIEQLKIKGMYKDVLENVSIAADIVNQCLDLYGCDAKLVEVAVNIISTASSVLRKDAKTNEFAENIAKYWDNNQLFRKCAGARINTLRHFQRNPALAAFFPRTAETIKAAEPDQGITKGQHSGTIQRLVDQEPNPYGFILCEELGSVYFNRRSLFDNTDWDFVKQGLGVNFDIIATKKPYLPRAIKLRLDSRE